MTFLVVLVIVAILSLVLGMLISNNQNARSPEHRTNPHSSRSGWGWVVGMLLAVPCILVLMAVVSWMIYQSRQKATVDRGSTEAAYHRVTSGEAVVSDRAPRLPRKEAPVAGTEPDAVTPVEIAASHNDSGESPDPPAEIGNAALYDSVADTVSIDPASAQTSSSTSYEIHSIPTPGIFGIGLLCLAMLIGAGVWIAHRRRHWSLSGMARSTVRSLWVVPVLGSIAWVGYLIWPHLSVEPLERNTAYNAADFEFDRYSVVPQHAFRWESDKASMPQWVADGITSHNGLVHVPVHGGWWDTQEGARNRAREQALATIKRDFALTYPDAGEWRIDVAFDGLNAKSAEVVETHRLDSGEIKYRAHLLVELSDEVRNELVDRWKPQLQEFRMAMLLTFGGLLTLVCFAGAACLNLDLRTEGEYRRWLRFSTVLVVVAAAAVAHGILNSLWFPHSV